MAFEPERKREGLGRLRWQSALRLGWLGIGSAFVVAGAMLLAIIGPIIASSQTLDYSNIYAAPSSSHLLGTDALGRDIFLRLLAGSRSAVLGPLIVIVLATIVGCTMALIATWYGGAVDSVIARAIDILFAVPGILLAILAVSIFSPGLVPAAAALAIAYTPYVARLTRASALRERRLPYINALMLQGQTGWRITTRHLLPNVLPVVLAQATVLFGYALIDLAAISFLGLGVQPPTADWGVMVEEGQTGVLSGHPAEAVSAGVAIVIVVLAVNILGERLLDLAEGRR